MPNSEDSNPAGGFMGVILIAATAALAGGMFVHYFGKKPAKCPPVVSCATADTKYDWGKEVLSWPALRVGERVQLKNVLQGYTEDAKPCWLVRGSTLTVVDKQTGSESALAKVLYAPTTDPAVFKDNECPAGFVGTACDVLEHVIKRYQGQAQQEAEGNAALRKLFKKQ